MTDVPLLFLSTPRAPELGHRVLVSRPDCDSNHLEEHLQSLDSPRDANDSTTLALSREVLQAGKTGAGRVGREWLVLIAPDGLSPAKREQTKTILRNFLEEHADDLILKETDWSSARNTTVVYSPALDRLLAKRLDLGIGRKVERIPRAREKPSTHPFSTTLIEDPEAHKKDPHTFKGKLSWVTSMVIAGIIIIIPYLIIVSPFTQREAGESPETEHEMQPNLIHYYIEVIKSAENLINQDSGSSTINEAINKITEFKSENEDFKKEHFKQIDKILQNSHLQKELKKTDRVEEFKEKIRNLENAKNKHTEL